MKPPAPAFFATREDFRTWLRKNSTTAPELIVGYWKVNSGRPSITWSESVDEALCFGWIDGVRRRIDESAYHIRFTPRRPTSIWSAVNLNKYKALLAAGRVTEAGKRAYECRREEKSKVYSYEQAAHADLTPEEAGAFKAVPAAWDHFEACPPSYRKALLHWIASARRPDTRAARLAKLIAACERGERLR